MKKNDRSGDPSTLTLSLAVVLLLAGVSLQLSYALKLTKRPEFLLIGSALSFAALLLAPGYNRQRRGK